MIPFVTAKWTDLLVLSYAVPDEVLAPYMVGTRSIDRWGGSAYVSVVGFNFERARMLGINPAIVAPGASNFAQWNLRAYARDADSDDGIIFIEEFVPVPAVTAMVRATYHENYHTARIRARSEQDGESRRARVEMTYRGHRHMISMATYGGAELTKPGSAEHFLIERYTGWPAKHPHISFGVRHVPWRAYPVSSYVAAIDFEQLYGPEWAFLTDRRPDHVTWCEGSDVDVLWRKRKRR